jgi:hypothetical protein
MKSSDTIEHLLGSASIRPVASLTPAKKPGEELNVEAVFAKLKQLGCGSKSE